jgi:hypothetical protein
VKTYLLAAVTWHTHLMTATWIASSRHLSQNTRHYG